MNKFNKLYNKILNESSLNDVNVMTKSYLNTALWSTPNMDNKDNEPLDKDYNINDFSKEAKDKATKDCKRFIDDLKIELTKYNKNKSDGDIVQLFDISNKQQTSNQVMEDLGHNFWLTRNGHGAGFFDGDYDEDIEKILMKLSHNAKAIDLYINDDNKVEMNG